MSEVIAFPGVGYEQFKRKLMTQTVLDAAEGEFVDLVVIGRKEDGHIQILGSDSELTAYIADALRKAEAQ